MKGIRKNAIIRIRIITGLVLFLSFILLGRLYQIQILQHETFYERAERQYVHTVRDVYSRGAIYFLTKNNEKVSAATVQSGYLLAINPSRITDAEATYNAINTVYPLERELFLLRANKKERSYYEMAQELTNKEANAIAALELDGVQLYRDRWRYYPGEDLSARTVGFVGHTTESNALTGRYGLERYYEDILTRDGEYMSVNFFAEIFTNLGSIIFDTTESRTGDVVTTIEPTVARMLDRELRETQDAWGSKITGGIIINPKNGEIYAMNAVPNFNLNNRAGAGIEDFKNPLVEDVYEMGSIIKALTVAAGIDSGAVSPSTTYFDG